jgi:hypothetical protein
MLPKSENATSAEWDDEWDDDPLESFETKQDAIAFLRKHFDNVDDEGRISFIKEEWNSEKEG